MTRDELLGMVGSFTWLWNHEFFIETNQGNFIWMDPDYGGNNSIRPYSGSLEDYLQEINLDYGRCKGKHFISEYCGKEFYFLEEP